MQRLCHQLVVAVRLEQGAAANRHGGGGRRGAGGRRPLQSSEGFLGQVGQTFVHVGFDQVARPPDQRRVGETRFLGELGHYLEVADRGRVPTAAELHQTECHVAGGNLRPGSGLFCLGQRSRGVPAGVLGAAGHCLDTSQYGQAVGAIGHPSCVVCHLQGLVGGRPGCAPATLPELQARQPTQPKRQHPHGAACASSGHGSLQQTGRSMEILDREVGEAENQWQLITEIRAQRVDGVKLRVAPPDQLLNGTGVTADAQHHCLDRGGRQRRWPVHGGSQAQRPRRLVQRGAQLTDLGACQGRHR